MIRVLTQHRTAPQSVQDRITRAGGRNIYGWPNFRVVWGWDRLATFGGRWEDWEHDAKGRPVRLIRVCHEYRQMPKYDDYWHWHIEKWVPASFFGGPDYWRDQYTERTDDGREFLELGPFPNQGEYELSFTIEDMELTPTVVDTIVRAIEWSRYVVKKDKARSLEALRRREAQKELDWHNYADAVLDDAAPAFGLQPRVFMNGSGLAV